jgi:hypothetical protein
MPKQVVNGAMMKCTFGASPGTLTIPPVNQVDGESQPSATIMDFQPMANVGTFGMCTAPSNPQVIAAQGSPVPCVPVTVSPWTPGSPVTTIQEIPALIDSDQCTCIWMGVITITYAGQAIVNIDS